MGRFRERKVGSCLLHTVMYRIIPEAPDGFVGVLDALDGSREIPIPNEQRRQLYVSGDGEMGRVPSVAGFLEVSLYQSDLECDCHVFLLRLR